jgi:hypothetical protein
MSIDDLKQALKARTAKRAIILSGSLFKDLYLALDLKPIRQDWPVLTDPPSKKVLDAWLKQEKLPTSDLLIGITWHLVWHSNVRVLRDIDMLRELPSTGPASFEIL